MPYVITRLLLGFGLRRMLLLWSVLLPLGWGGGVGWVPGAGYRPPVQAAAYAEEATAGGVATPVCIRDGRFWVRDRPFTPAGINYYPQATPWFDFWNRFDPAVVRRDLARIRALGANTIRVFVFYELFGGANPHPEMLGRLVRLLDQAEAAGLHVVVTLFDFLPSYAPGSYPAATTHLAGIVSAVRHHPALLAWDVKNEPDLDFARHGRTPVLEWLTYMVDQVQRYDPDHPVTIGWSAAAPALLLRDRVDFLSFHFYEPAHRLGERLRTLQAGAPATPILISEFGLFTLERSWYPGGYSEAEQAAYYQEVLQTAAGFPEVSWISWTLYDFPRLPAAVFSGSFWQQLPQQYYGLLRFDGSPKPAAGVLRAHLRGQ